MGRVQRDLHQKRQSFVDPKLSDVNLKKSVTEDRRLKHLRSMESKKVQRCLTTMFDAKGRYRASGLDICDCLDNTCPGCHFPCQRCENTKCGPCCRVNRKWPFECIENENNHVIVTNKMLVRVK